jgi:hypothetical protein
LKILLVPGPIGLPDLSADIKSKSGANPEQFTKLPGNRRMWVVSFLNIDAVNAGGDKARIIFER